MENNISTAIPPGFELDVPASTPEAVPASSDVPPGFELDEEHYGTPIEQLKTLGEGALKGGLSAAGPYIETKFGVKPEDIRGREETNPITKGIGEFGTMAGTAMLGTGLGGALAKSGEIAAGLTEANAAVTAAREAALASGATLKQAAEIGQAAWKAQPLSARVGSSIIRNAAEMAVYQSGDEVAKKVIEDPQAASESALAHIGMAAALGGAGGAAITGVVSPLWSASFGPKLESGLKTLTDHLNKTGTVLPEQMEAAAQTLGVDVGPEIRAANSSPEAAMRYNGLKRMGNPAIQKVETDLSHNVANSVVESTGRPIEEFHNFDRAVEGREAMEGTKAEARAKNEPIIKEFNALTEPFKNAVADPATHLATMEEKISDLALNSSWVGKDIPQYKIVNAALERIKTVETAEDLKRVISEIGNIASSDYASLGYPSRRIKEVLMSGMQDIIGDSIKETAPQLFDRYVAARKGYAQLASVYDRMGGELGIGKFSGPEGFLKALEKRSPEEFLRRLSPEGNAELLPFLQEHFPTTLGFIKNNEMKKIIAPAVRAAKGELPINIKTLQANINKKMEGQESFVRWALPEELIKKAEAAEVLSKAIPGIKDSGTPGGLLNLLRNAPASAMGAIAAITGHNPFIGALLGHAGQVFSRDVPDAINLAALRFLGSDQPIKAEGFKSMVEMIRATYKGENMINSAVKNLMKGNAQVITANQMPSQKDRDALDNRIESTQQEPLRLAQQYVNGSIGHYMPDHQQAMAQAATNASQYLASLKPAPFKPGALDKPIPPSKSAEARYNRALDIAQQPAIVLQHIKDGTLQVSDIQDLRALYPKTYDSMSQKLLNMAVESQQKEQLIPYKTRMSMSLFLGQPLDASMQPASIMAAQPKPTAPPPQQQGSKGKPNVLKGKSAKMYQTPNQASESDRSNRD